MVVVLLMLVRSAGCGRTGTFCAIDILLTYIQEKREEWMRLEKDVVYDTISNLRQQRKGMVKTLEQFMFCYRTVMFCTQHWDQVEQILREA
jgi:protein tyrosine phosphatase